MYIQIRTIDAKRKVTIDVSKTTPIVELKKLLEARFDVPCDKQRLFFRGKQLEDGYTIFDYSINLNDMVQLMEKVTVEDTTEPVASTSNTDETSTNKAEEPNIDKTEYFQVGEFVDVRDLTYGAWFEAKITKIIVDTTNEPEDTNKDDCAKECPRDGYLYEVSFLEDGETTSNDLVELFRLRPRAREQIQFKDIKKGQMILANYNIEDDSKRGYWYDCIVKEMKKGSKTLIADVIIGDIARIENCKIAFCNELLKIEKRNPLSERQPNTSDEPSARATEAPMSCDHCNNNQRRKCRECGCRICGLKTNEEMQIMCDECDYAFHIWCLKPPMEEVPNVEEWYCPDCKNDENEIVAAGDKLKESKKKAKLASKQNNSSRDWGKGMACVARTKVCTLVPNDHFGPIPGVEVGSLWKFRIQVSEAGVHRPHVAGIHGRETIGAFSVVLSGGYEDDVDNGDEVYYTGSGGRDLSGNKRTNAQGFDQTLSRFNKALALNCNVPLNPKGAEAKDWRAGKPLRLVRNYKLGKHSKYAPEEGNRYDGIYKVVKYFPKKGKSGFTVWRFLFRRDDPVPAPWTKKGQERIESLGLEMQFPEGHQDKNTSIASVNDEDKGDKGVKRVLEESSNPQPKASTKKKTKVAKYVLEDDIDLAISKDTENVKLWEECKKELDLGKQKFLAKVEETFTCICCTELTFKPITTPCLHNLCSECLKRSFQAKVVTCPTCRSDLEKDLLKKVNTDLQSVLDQLFTGYSASR